MEAKGGGAAKSSARLVGEARARAISARLSTSQVVQVDADLVHVFSQHLITSRPYFGQHVHRAMHLLYSKLAKANFVAHFAMSLHELHSDDVTAPM